jgi:hypothetical protein
LIFAHRAFWAAAILALPSALIIRRAVVTERMKTGQ